MLFTWIYLVPLIVWIPQHTCYYFSFLDSILPSLEDVIKPLHCLALPVNSSAMEVVCSKEASIQEASQAIQMALCRPQDIQHVKLNCFFSHYAHTEADAHSETYAQNSISSCWCGSVNIDTDLLGMTTFGPIEKINSSCSLNLDNNRLLWMSNLVSLELYGIQISGINYEYIDQVLEFILFEPVTLQLSLTDILHLKSLRVLSIRSTELAQQIEHWTPPQHLHQRNHSGIQTISQFEIIRSELKFVPDAFFQYFNVTFQLSLAHNLIQTISPNTFRYLYFLRNLILRFNEISHIDKSAFETLHNLNVLDISNNNIKLLDENIFIHMNGQLPPLSDGNVTIKYNEIDKYSKLFLKMANHIRVKIWTLKDQHKWLEVNNILDLRNQLIRTYYSKILNGNFETKITIILEGNQIGPQQPCFNFQADEVSGAGTDHYCFCNVRGNISTQQNRKTIQASSTDQTHANVSLNDSKLCGNSMPIQQMCSFYSKTNISNMATISQYIKCNSYYTLNLEHGKIQQIPPSSTWLSTLPFQTIYIKYFLMNDNAIDSISNSAFANVDIYGLDLNHNRISILTNETFYGLNLGILYMYDNRIHSVHPDTFSRMTNLKQLVISHNCIASWEEWIVPPSLMLIDIGYNKISKFLLKNHFPNLQTLNLEYNSIKEISQNSSGKYIVHKLVSLNLRGNNIQQIQENALTLGQENLEVDLSYNNLSLDFLQEYFSSINLLNLTFNNISSIEYLLFHRSIRNSYEIDLSNNNIPILNFSASNHLPIAALSILHLKHSGVRFIGSNIFIFLPFLTKLDLSDNMIHYFYILPNSMPQRIVINLENNPLHCSCEMRWLRKDPSLWEYYKFNFCKDLVTQKNVHFDNFNILPLQDFVCQTPCDSGQCECYSPYDNDTGQVSKMSCRYKHLKSLQQMIPALTIVMDMSHNDISQVTALVSNHVPLVALEELDLSHNLITHISKSAFNGLLNLQNIFLHHNLLQSFSSSVFLPSPNLRILYLNDNKIRNVVYGDGNNVLNKLQYLDLSNNKLSHLKISTCESIINTESLSILRLQGNPWNCHTCQALHFKQCTLMHWSSYLSKSDIKYWMCDDTGKGLERFDDRHAYNCSRGSESIYIKHSPPVYHNLVLSLTFLFGTIVFVLCPCVIYNIKYAKYRRALMHHLTVICHRDVSQSKRFDAYIVYDSSNVQIRRWVVGTLLHTLEMEYKYNLIIEERDFLVGWPQTENILNAILKSQRTIFVLSEKIMDDLANRHSFHMAFCIWSQKLEHKMIFVKYGDNIDYRYFSEDQLFAICHLGLVLDRHRKDFWKKLLSKMPKRGRGMASVPSLYDIRESGELIEEIADV